MVAPVLFREISLIPKNVFCLFVEGFWPSVIMYFPLELIRSCMCIEPLIYSCVHGETCNTHIRGLGFNRTHVTSNDDLTQTIWLSMYCCILCIDSLYRCIFSIDIFLNQ